jgi:ankyrin repeat protein
LIEIGVLPEDGMLILWLVLSIQDVDEAKHPHRVTRAALRGDAARVAELLKAGAPFPKDEFEAYLRAASRVKPGTEDEPEREYELAAKVGLKNEDVSWLEVDTIVPLLVERHGGASGKSAEGLPYLHLAIRGSRSQALVRALLKAGADPNAPDGEGRAPLQVLLDEEVFKSYARPYPLIVAVVQAGGKPETALGPEPLQKAVASPSLAAALIEAGVQGRLSTDDSTKALVAACGRGYLRALDALLKQGVDPNRAATDGIDCLEEDDWRKLQEREGKSLRPLSVALVRGQRDVIVRLMAAGASTSYTDDLGAPLDWTSAWRPLFLPLLMEKAKLGAEASSELLFSNLGNLDNFRRLLDGGGSVNATRNGIPLLHAALAEGSLPVIRLLLERGAKTEFALHALASRYEDPILPEPLDALINDLIARGAELERRNDKGETPIFLAARNPRSVLAALAFLRRGATLRDRPEAGHDLLIQLAAFGTRFEADLSALLDRGAPPDFQPKDPRFARENTPLRLAVLYGSPAGVKRLLDAGADPNRLDRFGRSPLLAALSPPRPDVAQLLLDRGALLDRLETYAKVSARHVVAASKNPELGALVAAEDARRPLRQPVFPAGYLAAEAVQRAPVWDAPGWKLSTPDGSLASVADDVRRCDAAIPVAALHGWRVRADGVWSFWRDGRKLYDQFLPDPSTSCWFALRDGVWSVLSPAGQPLVEDLKAVAETPPLVGLILVRRAELWGAIDPSGAEVARPEHATPEALLRSLARAANAALAEASEIEAVTLQAARSLLASRLSGAEPAEAVDALRTAERKGGASAVAQVLDLSYGIGNAEAVAPYLKALGWAALPKDVTARLKLEREIQAARRRADWEEVAKQAWNYFGHLALTPLPGESKEEIPQRQKEYILDLRARVPLEHYFSYALRHDRAQAGGKLLFIDLLPPADQAAIKDIARSRVEAMERNAQLRVDSDAILRSRPRLAAVAKGYPEWTLALMLPEPWGPVLLVTRKDTGEKALLTQDGQPLTVAAGVRHLAASIERTPHTELERVSQALADHGGDRDFLAQLPRLSRFSDDLRRSVGHVYGTLHTTWEVLDGVAKRHPPVAEPKGPGYALEGGLALLRRNPEAAARAFGRAIEGGMPQAAVDELAERCRRAAEAAAHEQRKEDEKRRARETAERKRREEAELKRARDPETLKKLAESASRETLYDQAGAARQSAWEQQQRQEYEALKAWARDPAAVRQTMFGGAMENQRYFTNSILQGQHQNWRVVSR